MNPNLTRLVALAAQAHRYSGLHDAPRSHFGGLTARGNKSWYRVENAKAPDTAAVYLYDEIGMWGVTANDFVRDLASVTAPTISVHINSPGGDVFDAIAIHAALVNHGSTVNTVVDGLAASAASFIAQAGENRAIEKPAQMMIHDARGLVYGDPTEMRSFADLLDQVSDTIAGIYADRSGGTVAQFRGAMKATTWYAGPAAVDAGLADQVLNDTAPAADEAAATDRDEQMIRARRAALAGR